MDHDYGLWSAWLDEHGPALVLLARQWTESHAEAEDVVQDAFVRFWPKRASARNARAYMYACVRTAAMDRRRSQARRRRREELAGPADDESLFEHTQEHDERREMIERMLEALPDEQKEVVIMKIWGGLTFKRIGQALTISANTAASRYRYALTSMRSGLQQEQVE
ncbi:MAG: sigma-70 family RNA polymerase sigma factor [Phycisphaerae bacterium]|jgi:RNA polymerase sigma-70 factor (ECF subfamily)|nr:sigma-70 family RNA polymerase sigma factor [Phycisphaerae bacterium]